MKKIIVLLLVLVGCTADEEATRTLHNSGFTDVQTTGYLPFKCAKDDYFSTGFTAKNPRGQVVSGVVCCGALKSCTIRF